MQTISDTERFAFLGNKLNEKFDGDVRLRQSADHSVLLAKLRQIHADTDRVQFLMTVMTGVGVACLALLFIITLAVL